MSEEPQKPFNENNADNKEAEIRRKKHKCPNCKEILSDTYLEQHPFNEVPCSACGSLIDVSCLVA